MRPASLPSSCVIFLHIPKAAGSSLLSVLQNNTPRQQSFFFDWHDIPASIAAFKSLSAEQRRKYALLAGHIHFGIHEFLPQPASYLTMLREPVSRLVSHYYYAKRSPNHYLYPKIHQQNIGLEEYISGGHTDEMINGQTRIISGLNLEQLPGKTALERAKENIDNHFLFTGISELFDASLLLLQDAMQWPRAPLYVSKNISYHRKKQRPLPPEITDRINNQNQLDLELYEFVRQRVTKQIADLGADFTERLALFQRRNRKYQRRKSPQKLFELCNRFRKRILQLDRPDRRHR